MKKDENKHARNKLILKILGSLFALGGLALAVVGFWSFFGAMNNEEIPDLFWCCFVGFPLLVVGLWLLMLGFRRELAQYAKNESVPVFNQAAQQIKPGIEAISSAVNQGMQAKCACPACGEENESEAKYCKNCGAPLKKICPNCGDETAADAKFCDHCGKKL